MSLSPADRRRLEDLARPLYQGLDGADGWTAVGRIERTARWLGEGRSIDAATLEILAILHGVVERLGGTRPAGRLALALAALEEPPAPPVRLLGALRRWRYEPVTEEEKLLHDAFLLEQTGLAACLTRLLAAGRRRVPLERALGQLDPGPDSGRFVTSRGAEIAAARRARVSRWLEALEDELAGDRLPT